MVETRIRHAKETGIGRFPSREYAVNQARLHTAIATSIAADLVARLRLHVLLTALRSGDPTALRYRFPHGPLA